MKGLADTMREAFIAFAAAVVAHGLLFLGGAVFIYSSERAPAIGRWMLDGIVFVILTVVALVLVRMRLRAMPITIGEALGSLFVTAAFFAARGDGVSASIAEQWPAYLSVTVLGALAASIGVLIGRESVRRKT